MIEDRVGELHLKVRTDADAPELVRDAAERFVRASIERCAALLEARRPGRVVLLGRLPLRLALDEGALGDDDEIEAAARASADAIEVDLAPASLDRFDANGPVAFDNEAQWRASHLLARARGRDAWFHTALAEEGGDPWARLVAPDRRELAAAVLRHLAAAGALAEVLAAQSPLAAAVLAAAWGCDVLDLAGAMDDARVDELAAVASTWPALDTVARRLALHVHAAILLEAPTLRDAAVRQLATAAAARDTTSSRPAVAESAAAPDAPPAGVEVAPEDAAAPDTAVARTGLAGLATLVALMQELGLPETLWQACLPDGEVRR